jgi:ABC-type transport system substrate-binding protein
MRHIAYRYLAAISLLIAAAGASRAATRPHYGGTLRVMLQSSPNALDLFTNTANAANTSNAPPSDYWDVARTLSLIGDTLVTLDAQGRAHPALAVAWQSDAGARHWQFKLRSGVKFHDGSAASSAAVAQILGKLHPGWNVRVVRDPASRDSASGDLVSIDLVSNESAPNNSVSKDRDPAMPSLLAELALPRNLVLKRNANGVPIGTGPFLVAEWQPGKLLRLAAYEENWAGRPFLDAIEIEFGKSLHDQAIALELGRADVIELAPQASIEAPRNGESSFSSSFVSLPVELVALVFPAKSKAQDPRLREALALCIDRKPIQSVLLKGAGEPAASILPNWMTGYSALFSAPVNSQRARTLLAGSRQAALNLNLNLNYDPRDPQAQLIAERIALNAREVGITVQVSLSGADDIRLMRVVLPSPDPATSLAEAARQLELPPVAVAATVPHSLDDLYQAERSLLEGYRIIPLFHLPVAAAAGARVRNWAPDRLGAWGDSEFSLANVWLGDSRSQADAR